MKYCFCWQVERVVEGRGVAEGEVLIEDEEGRTVVVCGPWRDTKEEAERDGEMFLKDRAAFFRMIGRPEVG